MSKKMSQETKQTLRAEYHALAKSEKVRLEWCTRKAREHGLSYSQSVWQLAI